MRWFILYALALSLLPLSAQDPSSSSGATLTGGQKLPGTIPIYFRLHDVSYEMAIEGAGPREVPSGDEKLLVIDFEIENLGQRSYGLSKSTLRCAAVDQDEQFGEAVYDLNTGFRLSGTTRSGEGSFRPGQTRRLYTAIFVAARSTIDELEISIPGGEPVRVPIKSRIRPLPAELADAEGRLPAQIPARLHQRYVVGAYDLAVEPAVRESIGGDPNNDRILVPISVRNRAAVDVALNKGLITAYVADGDGERHERKDLLKGSEDRATGLNLAPGQTVTARIQFVVPSAFTPTVLFLSSASGRGSGHRYQFDLSASGGIAGSQVLGKYIPGETRSPSDPSATGSPATAPTTAGTAAPTEIYSAPTVTLEDAARRREAEILGATTSGSEPAPAQGTSTTVLSTPEGGFGGVRDVLTPGTVDANSSGELTVIQEERTLADEGVVQFAPLPETVRVDPVTRSGAIDFRRFTVGDPIAGSSGGDSPYLYIYWFRGRLGETNGAPSIFIFDDQIYYFGGYAIGVMEDWARKGQARDITNAAGRHVFNDLEPYEIYGGVVVVMDWEPGSSALRRARASAINNVLNTRWSRVVSGTQQYNFTSQDGNDGQKIIDESLARLNREFLYELSEAVRPEAEKNRDNAAEENEDRYVDTVACFWINLPGSDATSLQPAQVKDRLLQSITDSWRRYYASEYVRPPGNHSLPLYQHRAGNLKSGYITTGRIGPTYQISTGVELAGN